MTVPPVPINLPWSVIVSSIKGLNALSLSLLARRLARICTCERDVSPKAAGIDAEIVLQDGKLKAADSDKDCSKNSSSGTVSGRFILMADWPGQQIVCS